MFKHTFMNTKDFLFAPVAHPPCTRHMLLHTALVLPPAVNKIMSLQHKRSIKVITRYCNKLNKFKQSVVYHWEKNI